MPTNPGMNAAPAGEPLLSVRNVTKYFPIGRSLFRRGHQFLRAVDDVSIDLYENETLGLVGESGCGKTTLGRMLVLLERPTSGAINLRSSPELTTLKGRDLLSCRRRVQIVFQDPYSSLNPRMTAGAGIMEALEIHNLAPRVDRRRLVEEMLVSVGLVPEHFGRYPHEFSGGQRQRLGIARALAVNPEVLIADEPVSALDVSVQAQIVNLLCDLQEMRGLSMMFISHDLAVVGHISHRVAVMYLGRIVETGRTADVFDQPFHPYTQALLQAVPRMDPGHRGKRIILEGDVPSPIHPPAGCPFHPRCIRRFDPCDKHAPELRSLTDNRQVACHLYNSA